MKARQLLLVAVATVVACTGTPEASDDDVSEPAGTTTRGSTDTERLTPAADAEAEPATSEVPPPPGDGDEVDDCEVVDRARFVRSQSIPGGHRVQLHVTDPGGGEVEVDRVAECMTVVSDRLGVIDTAMSAMPSSGGATLIVARWQPDEVEASRAVIDELLATLPSDERVAIWAWLDQLLQVVGATTDRERAMRRLDTVWTADDATPLDPAEAADIAVEEWEDFRDDVLLGVRSVVFVAPTLDLVERPDVDRDVVVDHWVVGRGDAGRVAEVAVDGSSVAAASVARSIGLDRTVPLTVVDMCDDGESLDLTLSVDDRELRDFGIGDAAVEHVGEPCSIDALRNAADSGVPTQLSSTQLSSITVTFDETERSVFDDAVVIADALSGRDRFDGDSDLDPGLDPEWTGSISFDGGVTATPFDASFRGQSSIECERRTWAIDLEGGDERHPVLDSGTDEFTLISLCNDVGFVRSLSGSSVMARNGVWTQATGTAVFEIDDVNRGVYLLVEDPDTDLRSETSRVRSVLRRRYDAVGQRPDVEYVADLTSNDEASVLATYDELVDTATSSSGDDMVAALRARFDLDQYLRWTAVMSLLGSGDHIDELYFVGSESVDEQHEPITWFTVNGWDPDDIFTPCHRDGRLAMDDPNGLLACTESLLDQQLFTDPTLYTMYAGVLGRVMDDLTPERFTQIAEESAGDVTRHFDDPDVIDAMIELIVLDADATTPESATIAVDGAAERLVGQFVMRRSELVDLLDTYRAAN